MSQMGLAGSSSSTTPRKLPGNCDGALPKKPIEPLSSQRTAPPMLKLRIIPSVKV